MSMVEVYCAVENVLKSRKSFFQKKISTFVAKLQLIQILMEQQFFEFSIIIEGTTEKLNPALQIYS
jgi:hypothetical protein